MAVLDLTMNKGVSGGPVIKPGATIDDDEVIGIADFILGPFGQATEDMYEFVTNAGTGETGSSALDMVRLFSIVIANASNGIIGCLSINHFLKDIQTLK